jgi:alpha-ketoglutarate-dependent taurine dioxygenase
MQPDSKRTRFLSAKPRPVTTNGLAAVRTSTLANGQRLPLVVEPNVEGVNLAVWGGDNRTWIDERLREHGAVLFRGFANKTRDDFQRFAEAVSDALYEDYGDLPRAGVGGKIYTSTPYPNNLPILLHNESSHLRTFPQKIWFHCMIPAKVGGETPVADCRAIDERLDPDVRDLFLRKGLRYVRNFTPGFDQSWQNFFHTEDRADAERRCAEMGMEWEWTSNDGLRTITQCPAIIAHPVSGEPTFFNQIQLHHVACLPPDDRAVVTSLFEKRNLPRHVYFGDGTDIDEDIVRHVQTVSESATVRFPWKAGDVLMVDNLLVSHGRSAFEGERKTVVAMADMAHTDQMVIPASAAQTAGV